MPVSQVENQSAVINQGDFLTQLSNVQSYSSKLSDRFYSNYEKNYELGTFWRQCK